MTVEDVHEDRDAGHFLCAQPQFARRNGRADGRDHAVGGADHQFIVDGRHALGIAEEVGTPGRQDQPDPEQCRGENAEQQRHAREDRDEGIALPVDRDESVLDRVDKAHEIAALI
jgi:hypothetical protein